MSQIVKHLFDGSITLKDGTGTPVTLAVQFTNGDLTIDGMQESDRAPIAYETRGQLVSLRKGARSYATGNFSAMFTAFTDGTHKTLYDWVNRRGSYSANVSTTTAKGDLYTSDIVLTVEGTDVGDGADHVLTLGDCHISMGMSEGEPNTFSLSFTVNGAITATGSA